ncbi:MAG TPA: heme-binding protein [Mycobacterium sp.]|nr:MAG: hemophore-related protein [Mycobacterium sp.]HOB50340.1 heme-binding protein [Mycobacterium sp.]HPZ94775.1 heme-binding protein [Mycobacterium sp.]HQE15112.1 heme-binding protein [Mycobacterium sp.]
MSSHIRAGRRLAATVIAAGALAVGLAGQAGADPGCTVADITAVETGVAAGMTTYLWTHPDVNDFFTSLQGLSNDEAFAKTRDYLTANPEAKAQMDAIQAPADDLRARCNIPVDGIVRGVL